MANGTVLGMFVHIEINTLMHAVLSSLFLFRNLVSGSLLVFEGPTTKQKDHHRSDTCNIYMLPR